MEPHWRYRTSGVFGTAVIALVTVVLANEPAVRSMIEFVPVLANLPADRAVGDELLFEATTTTVVVLVAMVPLYKPRPRRILDTWMDAGRRTILALLSLATIGYFDYTYRLPRATLLVAGGLLLFVLPLWFVAIRRRPAGTGERTVIIGDDPETIKDILAAVDGAVIGYVSPPSAYVGNTDLTPMRPQTDGGKESDAIGDLTYLGGLSRLDEILFDYDVDTAILAFDRPDRAEFFGALDTCYEYGVAAKVHRDHADVVLTDGTAGGELVDVDLEPWDWQDHLIKRLFDIAFAVGGLVVLSPVIAVVGVAIKLDDGGPIFYSQNRTATFGDTFTIYKFRSMVPEGASIEPTDDDTNDRITRVGRFLRQTHLDEIPQLWSILVGDMSVVGPRAVWTEEEEQYLETTVDAWRKRWFVKPGLTGLAQIHQATSIEPIEKLRYDLQYIREQSFWFDVQIVVRQIWNVLTDVTRTIAGGDTDQR
ncbi:Sugar transferase involved in lipopolysaccharidesynthesis [Halorhabdus sp. SVX81]|uniref:sugar transferase n=1 Tax=Halorhabdus sp. SVX81 TaxID=2978283 RepID=UPI0023DA3837|nr:sugar transferase [Halorhabdus sp. SVX81]WEL16801.1 Sugar transferase involved in lipopolysaccharidesynthesis [Halorhabdus sp. SVX81]